MSSASQKNINDNTEKKIWWTTSRKVALGIGIFLFITLSLFLINDLFFWDIPVEYWITKQKAVIKHSIVYWALRFTFLTVQINLFFVVALLNYALNKKYSYFARRLLNFAFTYLVFGIFLYWTFVHFELADRFEQFETTLPSYLRSLRLYNYFHVYYSHFTTLVFALIAYIFAKKDLIMVKSDIWWSMLYVVIYIIGMFIMWAAKFIPAYQKTTGNYADKMNAGNEAIKYLYQFINFAKPVFMKNPIIYDGNKIVSPSLLWTKAIFLDILLIVCLFAMAPFLMFIWKQLFKIKTFKNVKEYKEFIKIDSNEKLIDLTNKKE